MDVVVGTHDAQESYRCGMPPRKYNNQNSGNQSTTSSPTNVGNPFGYR